MISPKRAARAVLLAGPAWTLALAATPEPGPALRIHVERLASEKLDGRMTGTDGEKRAARHIVKSLGALDVRPLPGLDGFRVPFDFTAGTKDAGSSVSLEPADDRGASLWRTEEHVRALSFSDDANVTGPVVFAGYGLAVPASRDLEYDSYATLDVQDKIVLVLRYSPEVDDEELRTTLSRYSGLRYKAMAARDKGAKAILVVSGPRSPNAGKTVGLSFDAALSGSGIAAASIGGPVAERIFARVEGRTLEAVQEQLDSGNPHVSGFEIPGLTLTLDVRVERERRTGHNVLAELPGRGDGVDRPYVLLGAHYDHLGRGDRGNSLADKPEAGMVHRGADDNASGVAALIAAAGGLARAAHRPPVILAFWSGEEMGLLGSSHFVDNPPVPIERIGAYFNLDMVGRMKDNRLNLQGAGSSPDWDGLIERSNVAVGFDVRTQDDPYLPTDASVFYRASVPILSFFTGAHEDYHRPSDVPEHINYPDLARVARFVELMTLNLGKLERPLDYVKVEREPGETTSRDGLRAYTGTIPDYATEVAGLRLSGVVGGGPADRSGLREGDVIVEFAGRSIANVYDYTYALEAVKIDQTITVVFLRDGKRLTVEITPTARP